MHDGKIMSPSMLFKNPLQIMSQRVSDKYESGACWEDTVVCNPIQEPKCNPFAEAVKAVYDGKVHPVPEPNADPVAQLVTKKSSESSA